MEEVFAGLYEIQPVLEFGFLSGAYRIEFRNGKLRICVVVSVFPDQGTL